MQTHQNAAANVLRINGIRLPLRSVTVEDDSGQLVSLNVPRGIARNNRNKSWQIKLIRNGKVVLTGNIADSGRSPAESLEDAIGKITSAIEEKPDLENVKSRVEGKWSNAYCINERITLRWKVVNTTPTLYITVYSPLLMTVKTVNVGSERKAENEEFFSICLARAMVYEKRALAEDPDPFRDVTVEEIDQMLPKVKALLEADEARDTLITSLQFRTFGSTLRAEATLKRAETIERSGIKSSLAKQALAKHYKSGSVIS